MGTYLIGVQSEFIQHLDIEQETSIEYLVLSNYERIAGCHLRYRPFAGVAHVGFVQSPRSGSRGGLPEGMCLYLSSSKSSE